MDGTIETIDPARSAQMARVRHKDTKPELRVRRMLHAAGLRYRLHDRRLPGNPDLIFASRRTVVLVHGCFWHRHPDPVCKLARLPKSRLDFWGPKLEGNRVRDARIADELSALGWRVETVWECETLKPRDLTEFAARIVSIPIADPSSTTSTRSGARKDEAGRQ